MKKNLTIILLLFGLTSMMKAQVGNIIFITGDTATTRDSLHIQFLKDQGYAVDAYPVPDPLVDKPQSYIDSLNSADIIIVGWDFSSNRFDATRGRDIWNNKITVPLLDIYPTLVGLCGLAEKPELEGRSLVPLLKDPNAEWDRAALTTHGRNNHSVRTERWRYTRYSDGTEELYDHVSDTLEWRNLAGEPGYADVKKELAAWLPKTNVPEIQRAR